MDSSSEQHIADADLIRWEDGEVTADSARTFAAHVRNCGDCQRRQRHLRAAMAAYREYREDVLQPPLQTAQAEWPSLRPRMDAMDGRERRRSFFAAPGFLWGATAAACVGALLVAYPWFQTRAESRQMDRILTDSAAIAATPASPRAKLVLTAAGRRWSRPAVLQAEERADDRFAVLFIKANYSWKEPLSARSFARWRGQLAEKQDRVTTIRDRNGTKRFYRLQTETGASILRTAALTLRSDTSRPVKASFAFAGNEGVEVEEDVESSPPVPDRPTPARRRMVETAATPEDMLHVMAALHAIGADEDDPIQVDFDGSRRHVMVTGTGLTPQRQEQVKEALRSMPNATVRFDSRVTGSGKRLEASGDRYVDASSPWRRLLEEKAGGAQQLQAITDRALDTSGQLLAQAHALSVLADKYPREVEAGFEATDQATLRSLRLSHAAGAEQTARQLQETLRPLCEMPGARAEETAGGQQWQNGARRLFALARNLNDAVSRLLTGPSEGRDENELRELPKDMERVERLARAQALGARL